MATPATLTIDTPAAPRPNAPVARAVIADGETTWSAPIWRTRDGKLRLDRYWSETVGETELPDRVLPRRLAGLLSDLPARMAEIAASVR